MFDNFFSNKKVKLGLLILWVMIIYQTLITALVEVEKISQSGAPKQYPNFFIDPEMQSDVSVNSLTQDVMLSSGKRKVKVYFDPDAIQVEKTETSIAPNGDVLRITEIEDIIPRRVMGDNDNNDRVYKMHLINVDRQLSEDFEINVKHRE